MPKCNIERLIHMTTEPRSRVLSILHIRTKDDMRRVVSVRDARCGSMGEFPNEPDLREMYTMELRDGYLHTLVR
jgi:hypothetical protein